MTIYVFNESVPAANDNPSNDQNPMLVNNQSTLGILGVDHVTFNTSGPEGAPYGSGGQHLQVTFNGDNIPPLPANLPVLFANDEDGNGYALPGSLSQLFYYSGDAAASKNNYVCQSNGSTFLFGGIIAKWGNIGLIGFPLTFASLGIASFPNNCFSVVVVSNNLAYSGNLVVSAVTSAGFTVTRTSGSGNTGYYFFAIGN